MYWAYQLGQFVAALAELVLVPTVGSARAHEGLRQIARGFECELLRHRPWARCLTSWSSQPLPSGSLNEANEP
jgi:hypothetical protein